MENKRKIMIIDDNLDFVNMITEYLSELDVNIYKLMNFEDENDIINKIEEFIPDVILLDINLGNTSGLKVIENLKRNALISKIPIIIITASDYNDIVASMLRGEKNIFGFCSKLEIEVIKDKLQKYLRGSYG
jgi:CheY-like chemotaxis protein